jgi:hypothetical protein
MRRIALLGLFALLSGCDKYVASPGVGFGGFIADTHTFTVQATTPQAVTEDEKLVEGEPVRIEPLTPEPGEVWPGPPPPIPTLQDVQSLTNMEFLPPATIPATVPPTLFRENSPQNGPQNVPPPGTVQQTP